MNSAKLFIYTLLSFSFLAGPFTYSASSKLRPRYQALSTIRDPFLVVVHASEEFDTLKVAKEGIDEKVGIFRKQGRPVVFLANDLSQTGQRKWYTKIRNPDFLLFSEGGEHNLIFTTSEATIVGGFIGEGDSHRGCLTLAARDLILSHFYWQRQKHPISIHLYIPGIYFYDDDIELRNKTANPEKDWIQEFVQFLFTDTFSPQLEFGHPYNDADPEYGLFDEKMRQQILSRLVDKAYQEGPAVTLSEYRFEFYSHGKLAATTGKGSRLVRLLIDGI